jgi:preprotein translocase subunit SecD
MKLTALCLLSLALAGCQNPPAATKSITSERARFHLESADESAQLVTMPRSGVQLAIGSKPVFTEHDIVKVSIAHIEQGECLAFEFTPAAARDLRRLTSENPGRHLVLLLEGVAFGARLIEKPLDRGVLLVFVETPDAALPALVDSLNETCAAVRGAPARQ